MAHELDGARAKLQWADRHRAEFNAETAKLNRPDRKPPFTSRKKFDAKKNRFVIRIEAVEELPDYFGLILGDAAHNYRSALDHVAWQLAYRQQGRTPRSNVSFPITTSGRRFHSPHVWSMLQEIGIRERQVIENCQPYRQPFANDLRQHPLALLSAWNNKDKHRLLHVVHFANNGMTMRGDVVRNCVILDAQFGPRAIGYRLHPGMELARVDIDPTGPNPDVRVRIEGGGKLALEERDPWGQEIPTTGIHIQLQRISEAVADVIRSFEPVFTI